MSTGNRSILDEFIAHCDQDGMSLAGRTKAFKLMRLPTPPGEAAWGALFNLPYLRRQPNGTVDVASGPLAVGIRMSPEYLREVSPFEVATVSNRDLAHPNYRFPVLCVGDVQPGMALGKLLFHLFEILTYRNYATDDGLDPYACFLLRENPGLLNLLPPAPPWVEHIGS